MSKKIIIKVENLRKDYDYFEKKQGLKNSFKNLFKRKKIIKTAVDDISFEIKEGEVVGFLGPNGAGKTTTMKMLSGILTPSAGKVEVLGFDPGKRQAAYQKQFALVMGQKNQLWWDLPPMESFLLNKEIYEIPQKDFQKRLDFLVENLQIKETLNKPVRKLSLGERMKNELVASLLHDPKVLFLDEPTIGLDVVAQKNIRDFLKKYNKEHKTTILLTSHYMKDIVSLCDRNIVINKGKIIYDGLLDDLIAKYAPNKMLKVVFGKNYSLKELSDFSKNIYKKEKEMVWFKVKRIEVGDFMLRLFQSGLLVGDIELSEVDVDSIIRNLFSGTVAKHHHG